jgi:hypothetical protein
VLCRYRGGKDHWPGRVIEATQTKRLKTRFIVRLFDGTARRGISREQLVLESDMKKFATCQARQFCDDCMFRSLTAIFFVVDGRTSGSASKETQKP